VVLCGGHWLEAQLFADEPGDLAGLRMAADPLLAENHDVVGQYLKAPAARWDQAQVGDGRGKEIY
jgi:hypothetical protein